MLRAPLTVQLEVTDQCNLRCQHCYHLDNSCSTTGTSPSRGKGLGDAAMLELAEEAIQAGVFSLVLTGGEPLLRYSLCAEIARRAAAANVLCTVNTNLILADEHILRLLISAGVDSLLVSCPSMDAETYRLMTGGGDLSQFLSKLRLLQELAIRHTVNIVVNHANLHEIPETVDRMARLGLRAVGVTPMSHNPANPRQDLALSADEVAQLTEELLALGEQHSVKVDIVEALPKCLFGEKVIQSRASFMRRQCQAGRTTMSIGCDGQGRPCSHNQDHYGNVLEVGFPEVWSRMSAWRTAAFIPDKCARCAMLSSCLGGCRVNAKAIGGSYGAEEPWSRDALPERFPVYGEYPDPVRAETHFSFASHLRWRVEGNDSAVICSKTPVNTTAVSLELLQFIKELREALPGTVSEIAHRFGFAEDDAKLLQIIRRLESKEFIFRSEQRKGVED